MLVTEVASTAAGDKREAATASGSEALRHEHGRESDLAVARLDCERCIGHVCPPSWPQAHAGSGVPGAASEHSSVGIVRSRQTCRTTRLNFWQQPRQPPQLAGFGAWCDDHGFRQRAASHLIPKSREFEDKSQARLNDTKENPDP
jgi:hypothetical protein